MAMRRGLLTLLLGVTALVPGSASAQTDGVWVTKVLVNRLGGVSVVGQMTCAGAAAASRAGTLQASDESENWVTVEWQEGDSLVLLTNPDQYTVTQPSGRRTMVRVTHESSRAHPCYTDLSVWPEDGTPITCPVASVCLWTTDQFGYDAERFGPLFDYSSDGKFKTGSLNVTGIASGLFIAVVHDTDPVTITNYDDDGGNDFFAPYNQVLRAVSSR